MVIQMWDRLIRWCLVYWLQWCHICAVSHILMKWAQFPVHQDNIWQTIRRTFTLASSWSRIILQIKWDLTAEQHKWYPVTFGYISGAELSSWPEWNWHESTLVEWWFDSWEIVMTSSCVVPLTWLNVAGGRLTWTVWSHVAIATISFDSVFRILWSSTNT